MKEIDFQFLLGLIFHYIAMWHWLTVALSIPSRINLKLPI
ncbi:hypothetical protein J5U22_01642 [Saccharolobus shibatae]|uniref:Uncharacterized protein n=1 Tax=Saccharolobus shibatae TaxID=2286 RepID=A0A8F5C163_9CREN|nr:hypothetical protein J5U22_01642 [Saccharolobus shibatae]